MFKIRQWCNHCEEERFWERFHKQIPDRESSCIPEGYRLLPEEYTTKEEAYEVARLAWMEHQACPSEWDIIDESGNQVATTQDGFTEYRPPQALVT